MSGAAAITGEVYFTSIAVSIVLSLAALTIVLWRVAAVPAALFALSALLLSKSFVDFSTSGLENPLTHVLLALFVGYRLRRAHRETPRAVFMLSALSAALMVNRPDAGLLILPALAVVTWRAGLRRSWLPFAAGMVPLLAWEAFAVVYYGFPFPNTAYAKLKTGIPPPELVQQGVIYLLDSLSNDPLTLLLIGAALVAAAAARSGGDLAAGTALYIAYVVWVGGDFMSGRLLAAPLLCSVLHLAPRLPDRLTAGAGLAIGAVWIAGLAASHPTILSDGSYGTDHGARPALTASGIADERRFYYQQSGLLKLQRGLTLPNHSWYYDGLAARAAEIASSRQAPQAFSGTPPVRPST